ncbi:MAG: extracellular solute-binding protein, partial [Clostridia bacterium]|nr:extracellular solute-binding protein [Clostridia bacterium]
GDGNTDSTTAGDGNTDSTTANGGNNGGGNNSSSSSKQDTTKTTAKVTELELGVNISKGVLTVGDVDLSKALTKEQVVAKMPANLKNTKIHYFYWHDPYKRMEEPALKDFEKKTGISIDFEFGAANDFYQLLAGKVAAEKAPDMVRCRYTDPYALVGLQPVNTEKIGFDFSDPAWDKAIMSAYTVNGKCYAVNLVNSAILDVGVMYYNRKAMEDAGWDEDEPYNLWKEGKWTWNKFWEMCDEFVELKNSSGRSGYYGATFEYGNAYVLSMGPDAVYYDGKTSKYYNNLSDSTLLNSYKKTMAARESGALYTAHDMNNFENGKILFMFSGPFSCRTKDERQTTMKKRGYLGTVPMPTDSKYQILYETTAFAIPDGAKNPKAVPYLLRWILDQSSYDMDEVYCDSKAAEAVNYAIARGVYTLPHSNRVMSNGDTPFTFNAMAQDAAQLKTYFDSVSPLLDSAVESANKAQNNLIGQ